tara:strand:+ start:880 stop:1173 length:294 start_codon:yes stop_codon:yes gene_type:complete
MLEAFIFFVAGIFSYRIFSYVLDLGQSVLIIRESVVISLAALKISDELAELDDSSRNVWRNLAIMGLKKIIPIKYRQTAEFENWDEAMHYLQKNRRN